jgi:hypothetical protein
MSTQTADKIGNLPVPSVLIAQMEEIADAEGRTLDEVAQDAIQRFIDDRRWGRLVNYGKSQARALGLKSSDVTRLIDESRREHKR